MKTSLFGKVFNAANTIILTIIALACIYPFYYMFIYSLSDPQKVTRGVLLLPASFTIQNYMNILTQHNMAGAVLVSASRTVFGTINTLVCSSFFAYIIIKKELPFKKTIYRLLVSTMYINAGLIPWYLTMKAYGFKDSYLLYIIPSALGAFYVVLIKTYLESMPASFEESASLDGAGIFSIYFYIMLPLLKPVMAVIAVYSAVNQWNAWTDNLYLVNKTNLKTLQLMLYEFLQSNNPTVASLRDMSATQTNKLRLTLNSIRMTVSIVTIVPIFLVYPILQRYFIKGIMLGAIKG